ncbi:MAG: MBL fold metallo-hydrolase [Gemmatimonadota bacterium]|nr:MBL fold metallo-hydrolase [Gemmatimonadota bacterium]
MMIGGCGPSDQPVDEIFELEQVTDGVWATVVREGISPSQYAASLIVIRTDHVLVVDSRHDDESARRLLETVRGLTDLPVRYLVNTHWHGDHVHGNAIFREAFPDIQIIGGEYTGADMRTHGRARLDQEISDREERIATAEGWLEKGARDDGTPLTAEEIEALPGQIEEARAALEARRAIRLVAPTVDVSADMRLHEAEPRVTILGVGPAHTRSDVIVLLPDLGVMALGDLIEDGFPYLDDGSMAGWAGALHTASRLDATVMLGAHGPVLRDRGMLTTQMRFAGAVVDAARAGVRGGLTLEETIAEFDSSEYRGHFSRRVSHLPPDERAARYDDFVAGLMELAYEEAGRAGSSAEADDAAAGSEDAGP